MSPHIGHMGLHMGRVWELDDRLELACKLELGGMGLVCEVELGGRLELVCKLELGGMELGGMELDGVALCDEELGVHKLERELEYVQGRGLLHCIFLQHRDCAHLGEQHEAGLQQRHDNLHEAYGRSDLLLVLRQA